MKAFPSPYVKEYPKVIHCDESRCHQHEDLPIRTIGSGRFWLGSQPTDTDPTASVINEVHTGARAFWRFVYPLKISIDVTQGESAHAHIVFGGKLGSVDGPIQEADAGNNGPADYAK